MDDDTKTSALYAALAAAQAEFQPITKNREVTISTKAGGKYKFRYADLDEINLRTRPALTKHGLGIMQIVGSEPGGATFIETRLTHKDGGAVSARLDIKSQREYADPKEFGAAVTYLRRYQITPLLGVAADDDLDQNGRHPGNGDGDDGAGEKVSQLLGQLVAQVRATTSDKEALEFWNKAKAQLSAYPNAYQEFKDETVQHRRTLVAMAKKTEGAAA